MACIRLKNTDTLKSMYQSTIKKSQQSRMIGERYNDSKSLISNFFFEIMEMARAIKIRKFLHLQR